jgi:putative heme-binding domain-containing protein
LPYGLPLVCQVQPRTMRCKISWGRWVPLVAGLLIGALAAPGATARAQQDHPGQYSQADIDAGARVYNTQCAQCHGPNGDQVSGIDLRRGQFRRVASDEDLQKIIGGGLPATGMPPFALQPSEMTGVIAFIRAGFNPAARPVKIGTASRGQAIVEGKGECLTCHRVGTRGSRVAPDLTDIGAARTAEAIHRTLVEPSSGMMPINRPVRIVTKDGRTITGRRLNEDTYTVQVIDREERLHSFTKADLRSYVVETKSPMPSYAARLSEDELADVIAYLLTLKGFQP